MTDFNTADVDTEGLRLEARRRLKRLRQDRGLSVEKLAALIERSPSSVRAHENGQNGISRQAADLYAQALGVSPSFILWGSAEGQPSELPATVREVSLVGDLAGDIWLDSYSGDAFGSITLSLPEYEAYELTAFIVARSSRYYRKGDYVVVAPPDVGVRPGDHLVVRLDDGLGRTKLSLTEVEMNAAGLSLKPISGGADRLGVRTAWNRESPRDDVTIRVLGPVVAYGGRDRPATGPIIAATRLMDLNKLA